MAQQVITNLTLNEIFEQLKSLESLFLFIKSPLPELPLRNINNNIESIIENLHIYILNELLNKESLEREIKLLSKGDT